MSSVTTGGGGGGSRTPQPPPLARVLKDPRLVCALPEQPSEVAVPLGPLLGSPGQ